MRLALTLLLAAGLPAGAAPASAPPAPTLLEPGRPRFRVHGIQEGLPHSSVMALAQDRQGRLWAGTHDGAAYYDGHGWTVVDMPERQDSNYIHAVLAASDGSMWFARQDGGVARRQEGRWTRWTTKEGLPANRVHSLLETQDGKGGTFIWAATYGGGLARWDGRRWEAFPLPGRARGLWKLSPVPGDPRALWVAGEDGTLVRVSPEACEAVPGLPPVSINQVLERKGPDGAREVWISTYGQGVARWRGGTWTFFRRAEGLPNDFGTDLAETRSIGGVRTLWAATLGGLASLEDGKDRWTPYTLRSGLPTETLYRLMPMCPPDGPYTLWIGTSGAGVLALREGGWRVHDAFSGLPGNVAWSLTEFQDGNRRTLLSASTGGIAEFDGRRWRGWDLPPALAGRRISAIEPGNSPDGRPELWVGALGRVARYQAGRWEVQDTSKAVRDPLVSALAVTKDRHGQRVWAGSTKGLLVLEEGRWRLAGLPEVGVDALEAGKAGPDGEATLWVGTRGVGIARLEGGRISWLGRREGLPNTLITDLILARDGRELWVATNGGGAVMMDPADPSRPRMLLSTRSSPPLPSDAVQGLAEDREGNIWLATNRGVARLRRPGPSGGPELQLFTEEDGLPSDNANPRALYVDGQDRAWVGTRSGIGVLDLSKLPEDRSRPPLVLHRVSVNGQPPTAPPAAAAFGYRENRLGFTYSLLTFHGEQGTRYRTQLEGLEERPTEWSRETTREFSGLAPGAYCLKVWARDWRGQELGPLAWSFSVEPAFWQRRDLQAALGLLLAALAYLSWRARVRLLHARSLALAAEVEARTSDLRALNAELGREVQERRAAERVKDEFTAVVSHELRTPLTAIRGALGLLEDPAVAEDPGQRRTLMDMATRNVHRLLTLVDDLLDMKQIESGRMQLSPRPMPLAKAMSEAIEANALYAGSQGVRMELAPGVPPGLVLADPRRLDQILANLLSNAAKFSPRGSTILAGAGVQDGMARVWVHNDGDPIADAFRERIFQKFAQAESGSTRQVRGTGLGLAISKALVEAMGGRIGFESGARGTTFWFTLPLA